LKQRHPAPPRAGDEPLLEARMLVNAALSRARDERISVALENGI
jgi:hypothetical protein